jgi:hypothetical protein
MKPAYLANLAFAVVSTAACGGGNSDASSLQNTPMKTATASTSTAGINCALNYSASNTSTKVNANSSSSWTCNTVRTLTANGIPDHAVTDGNFATPISAQTVLQNFNLSPAVTSAMGTRLVKTASGYVLNGVKLDPETAGTCSSTATSTLQGGGCVMAAGSGPWNLEAIGGVFVFGTDASNGHVQPNGQYHYHGMPVGYVNRVNGGKAAITLVGFAVDGFPIYAKYGYSAAQDATSGLKAVTSSYQKLLTPATGRPSTTTFPLGTFTQDYQYAAGSGDLDECNGRFGVTPEFPGGIYHYYITETFPYVQRCVKGSV